MIRIQINDEDQKLLVEVLGRAVSIAMTETKLTHESNPVHDELKSRQERIEKIYQRVRGDK